MSSDPPTHLNLKRGNLADRKHRDRHRAKDKDGDQRY